MILVDIGNSGLRAARVSRSREIDSDKVTRLSWSASIAALRKPKPEQESAPNQRWCQLEEPEAFDWLLQQLAPDSKESWLISSVQRRALDQLIASMHRRGLNIPPRVVSYRDLPMKIDVEAPERTGTDRLLAAWAASALVSDKGFSKAAIVVQAGTAVTVDLVDAAGVFRGGSIMPGLGLALQLLAAGTDQLPWLSNHAVETQPTLPGKNTEQAIAAGVNAALVGGVAHLVERYRNEVLRDSQVHVIVSGGDGRMLLPCIPPPVLFVDHIVLNALQDLSIHFDRKG